MGCKGCGEKKIQRRTRERPSIICPSCGAKVVTGSIYAAFCFNCSTHIELDGRSMNVRRFFKVERKRKKNV